jgi:hypothetical protein
MMLLFQCLSARFALQNAVSSKRFEFALVNCVRPLGCDTYTVMLDGRPQVAPTGTSQSQTYGIGGGDATGASPFFSTALFVLLGIIAVAIAVAAL